MGEAYFLGLCAQFVECRQREKLELLARVERHSVSGVVPLLAKYNLRPRRESELSRLGAEHVLQYEDWSWMSLIKYMVKRYPMYLEDFAKLESLAPLEDRAPLSFLTKHEVAAIDFAERELAGISYSEQPLHAYLESGINIV